MKIIITHDDMTFYVTESIKVCADHSNNESCFKIIAALSVNFNFERFACNVYEGTIPNCNIRRKILSIFCRNFVKIINVVLLGTKLGNVAVPIFNTILK